MRKILDSPPIFGHYYVKRVYKVFDIKLTDYRVKNFKYPYCVIMSENRETMDVPFKTVVDALKGYLNFLTL